MTVVATDLGDRAKETVCAEVAWTRLLVFGSTLNWCRTPRKATTPTAIPRSETTLSGVGSFALKWGGLAMSVVGKATFTSRPLPRRRPLRRLGRFDRHHQPIPHGQEELRYR